MAREDLWRALADAADPMQQAIAEWEQDNTPATRAKADTTCRTFLDRLDPILGHETTFRLEASWQAVMDACDRKEQLRATMATQSTSDEADAELMRRLGLEIEAALKAFELVEAATQAALDEAL